MSKINPKVPIELDKPRNLLFNLNAMVAFEEATGKNMLKGESMSDMAASDIRALLWACLKQEDPNLTLEAVGELIDLSNIGDVSSKLTEAWTNATPDEKPKNE